VFANSSSRLAAFLLTAGSLADMYGRRLLWLIGLVVITGASVLCGFAVSTLMLQLSRALQGIGGAIMFAVSLALLADAFRGRPTSVVSQANTVAIVAGHRNACERPDHRPQSSSDQRILYCQVAPGYRRPVLAPRAGGL
jgi:MFS family permease